MHELIWEDLQGKPVATAIEIYIGDYIDRGPDSSGVLEELSTSKPICGKRICLKGNHEQILGDFLEEPGILPSWIDLGGLETLSSYGLRVKFNSRPNDAKAIHYDFLSRLPLAHSKFIHDLRLSFELGGYFFAHAGVRPGVRLSDQTADDLLWIREPFLSSMRNFGAVVVHGHTPSKEPVVSANRICIDTGAFITGNLTCLVLQGGEKRFLTASLRASFR
jgi:serine/threonine protein phosphatase 1